MVFVSYRVEGKYEETLGGVHKGLGPLERAMHSGGEWHNASARAD
jgi:hypothetical protein